MLAHNLAIHEEAQWHSSQERLQVQNGLPYSDFESLRAAFQVSTERLAKALGINPRTLQRRKQEGRLTFVESDRLYRYIDVFRTAAAALESAQAAASWLTREHARFDGMAPMEFAATEPGYLELREVIQGIAEDSFG